MKNKLIYVTIFLVIVGGIVFYFQKDKRPKKNYKAVSSDRIFAQTYNFSEEYIQLRYRTDKVLKGADKFKNYTSWNAEMTGVIGAWQQMADHADFLNKVADSYLAKKDLSVQNNFINSAQAYNREEISNVFDKAPAGKKIKTLAKFLGVDARRAYKILINDQEQVKADAWNKAGDTFKKLETSAVVIKDGCKVTGYVGGIIMTGGTAGFIGQAATLTSGADLVLEVTDDAATIGLGDNNKISAVVANARVVTEPGASILAIADMPGNLEKGVDKFNAFMFGADQVRSIVQDKKIIGIDISSNGKTHVSSLDKKEVKGWIKKYGSKKSLDNNPWLKKLLKEFEVNENKKSSASKKEENKQKEEKPAQKEKPRKSASSLETNNDSHYGEIKAYGKNGKTYVSIVSPTEASFQEGQARLWQANVVNYQAMPMEEYECSWTFYLDDKKYKEQNKTCKFTGSYLDKAGQLKVEVKVRFYKSYYKMVDGKSEKTEDEIETITAKRFYEITPTPKDTYRHP